MAFKKSTRHTARKDGPHPIDVAVGARVRERRILKGLSQEKLGDAIGLTFQQVQKYERGYNRISSSRLTEIAGVLECRPSELLGEAQTGTRSLRFDRSRRALELVRHFERINDPHVQRRMFDMVKACAGRGTGARVAAE